MDFFKGQAVRLRPDVCTEWEQRYVYIITAITPERKEAFITCLNSTMSIAPTERVTFDMIESL